MRVCLVLMLLVVGCGVDIPMHFDDGGSGTQQTICPAHPDHCAGTCCGNECLDTMNDPHNCGTCGMTCASGSICVGGHCGCPPNGLPCGSGQTCCGMLGCVSLDSDIRNCGSCGHHCDNGMSCSGGTCH
jgi:hypothetical protein